MGAHYRRNPTGLTLNFPPSWAVYPGNGILQSTPKQEGVIMFMPFYMPGRRRLRVVVAGGGYAGLAALSALRTQRPDADLVLIDPRPHHLKITRLHESFRRPLAEFQVPFSALGRRFGFRHVQAALPIDEPALSQWNTGRALTVDGAALEFDYLLIATGGSYRKPEKSPETLDLDDFSTETGSGLIDLYRDAIESRGRYLTVVGGGATGIQFLFEIAHYLQRQRSACRLRLVDADPAPLGQFRPGLGRYTQVRLADLGIDYHPDQRFQAQADGVLQLQARASGQPLALASDLTLLFLGNNPAQRWEANWFGQVVSGGAALERIYTAGDCSRYRPPGSNALSAQTALRKGRLAARNILRHASPMRLLEPYLYRDLGYVVSLGPEDAVGWIGLERNVVGGAPAKVAKDIVEAQYDLLLAGVDTYMP